MNPDTRRSLALLAGLVALAAAVAVAAVAWWWPPPRPVTPTAQDEVPPPVPYVYEWPDGATRGIDVPTHIYIPTIDRRIPIQFVKDIRSLPGEDRLAFLHRVRLDLVAYSARQEVEACAEICAGDDGLSVRVTSINAVAYCAVAPVCMAGHATTQESIHSHCPGRRALTANVADETLSGGVFAAGDTLPRCDTERFSRLDLSVPRGTWLAARRRLLHKPADGAVTAYPGETGAR